MEIADKHKRELPKIKKAAETAYRYFYDNNQRYEQARQFLYVTTLTDEMRASFANINWPLLEVNTLESFVSRLAGEFSKQIPCPSVSTSDENKDLKQAAEKSKILAGRLRYIFESGHADNCQQSIYTETLSGGFSCAKLRIDYLHEFSFDQDVYFEKVYDPMLCYFDPSAREVHKGDGKYCGELIPMTVDDFKSEYPHADLAKAKETRSALTDGSLSWYYTDGAQPYEQDIVYVADHYVKKDVRKFINLIKIPNLKPLKEKLEKAMQQFLAQKMTAQQVQQGQPAEQQQMATMGQPGMLPQTSPGMIPPTAPPFLSKIGINGQQPTQKQQEQNKTKNNNSQESELDPFIIRVLTDIEYEAFKEAWKEHSMLALPPVIDRRKTTITEIWHYRFIPGQLLEKPKKLPFTILPLIYFDGNSHIVQNKQVTRPYIYQAKGAQNMKNLAAMAMMQSIQTKPRSRLLMSKESIPQEPAYRESLTNPQSSAAAIVYNSKGETTQNESLNPPIPLNFPEFGAELLQLYKDMDQTIQMILGNFDHQIGMNQRDLSGKAIVEGATQSNNAAMPYVINFMASMTQVSKGIIEVIPKLYNNERSMHILDDDGISKTITINKKDQEETALNYEANDFKVVVKSSVNFEIQKNRSFDNITTLMSLPEPNQFKQFFGGPAATDLLDNMTIRNQDSLKIKFIEFQEDQERMMAQNEQKAMMMNPIIAQKEESQRSDALKAQQLNLQAQAQQSDQKLEGMKVLESFIDSTTRLRESEDRMAIEKAKIDAENARTKSESITSVLNTSMKIDEHAANQIDKHIERMSRVTELQKNLEDSSK